jgi:hypothetical protein
MGKKLSFLFLSLALAAAILANPRQVRATLGEPADSVATDRKALSAVRRATTVRSRYTVQEVETDSTIVRQYVAPSGVVFGIAWNGLVHPDLALLLGSYASEYDEALRRTPRKKGLRRLQVKAERVVVEKWGHMRNLQGRAYDPSLIPSGVSVDEIR